MTSLAKMIIFSTMICLMLLTYVTFNRWQHRLPERWTAWVLIVFVTYRVSVFIFFLALGFPLSGDAVGFWDYVQQIHAGRVPLRDLVSSYGTPYNPFFYYVISIANTPSQMRGIFCFLEVLSFFAFLKVLLLVLPERQVQLWSILYLLSPVPIFYGVYSPQEDVWILCIYTFSILTFLVWRGGFQSFIGGMIMAIGLMITKLAALLPLPFMISLGCNRVRVILGYLSAFVLSLLFVLSWDPKLDRFAELLRHSSSGAGSTLWRFLNGLTHGLVPIASPLYSLLFFSIIWFAGIIFWLHFNYRDKRKEPTLSIRGQRFILGWIVIWALFFLLSPHVWPAYIMFWLAPILALLVIQKRNQFLVGATVFVSLYPALNDLFFRAFDNADYSTLNSLADWFWVSFDLLLLGCYAFIGLTATRLLLNLERSDSGMKPTGRHGQLRA